MATAATTTRPPVTRTDPQELSTAETSATPSGLLRRLAGLEVTMLLAGAIAVSV